MLWVYRFFGSISRLLRRLFKVLFLLAFVLAAITTAVVLLSGDENFRYALPETVVNDVTKINPVHVARVIRPETVEEISAALSTTTGPVSIGGGRFSQGGQTAYPDSLHLDMRSFDDVVSLDVPNKRITVQSGITWRDIQAHIDPHDLAVRIMQTYANFTVGGSLSVNVHGRYIGEGPLVGSVESIRLVLADGSVVSASPGNNSALFYGAIGGYGGIGVITEATLHLADNKKVQRHAKRMKLSAYREHFLDNVRDNGLVVFHNADLYPPEYDDLLDVTWYETENPVTIPERLRPDDADYFWQPLAAEFVARAPGGLTLREHVIDPLFYRKDIVAWRNWEASYDVAELEPRNRDKHTYVLREYFVPVDRLEEFVGLMGDIFNAHDVDILNVSIRHAKKDPGTLLAWAREEVYALVVYYRQGTSRAAREQVAQWSRELIDAAISVGGTYYLPYQVYATPEQFNQAYPDAPRFFALKKRMDPGNRFRNRLWAQHYPENHEPLDRDRAAIAGYRRGEEQTLLTLPEWYLVFNPLEYAEFLEAGHNPSDFPFMDSIDEYWTLYDRVRLIVDVEDYPPNGEYLTMLRVIGISTTVEFMIKAGYEKSIGRFTRWTAGGEDTPEDMIVRQAHRAYSDLIFDEAWYRFDFSGWVGKVWSDTAFFGDNFLRKLERKLFFTAEFGFKALYAKLIGAASAATYGEQEELIYFTVTAPDTGALPPAPAAIVATHQNSHIVSVPRWGPFSETLPKMAMAGFEFEDISGNERIVVTLVADESDSRDALPAKLLFSSDFVSNNGLDRLVMLVRVDELRELITAANRNGLEIEHIYDY